jgi:predicted lipid-binding transport protein (Tim44 family)
MVPELFHDLMGQIQERGTTPNQTDVVTLNAIIIDERVENGVNWVTVRFSGAIREQANAAPQAFNEAWHFTQSCFTSNDPWKLAGIEPVQ